MYASYAIVHGFIELTGLAPSPNRNMDVRQQNAAASTCSSGIACRRKRHQPLSAFDVHRTKEAIMLELGNCDQAARRMRRPFILKPSRMFSASSVMFTAPATSSSDWTA